MLRLLPLALARGCLIGAGLAALAVALGAASCGGEGAAPATPTATPRRQGQAVTPSAPEYSAAGPNTAPDLEGAVNPAELAAGARAPADDRFENPLPGSSMREGGYFGAPRDGGLVHGGLDLEGDGPAVVAPCDGRVAERAVNDRLGRYLAFDCGDGWLAVVGFLGEAAVEAGARVLTGATVGRVDSTLGFVHFQLSWEGALVDPWSYLFVEPPPPTPTPSPLLPAPGTQPAPTATATPAAGESPAPPDGAPSPSPERTPSATPTSTATPTPPPPTPTPTRAAPTPSPTPTPRPVIR